MQLKTCIWFWMQKVSHHSHSLSIELQELSLWRYTLMSGLKHQETWLFLFTDNNWTVTCYSSSLQLVFDVSLSWLWTAAGRGCEIKIFVKSHTSRCLNLWLSTATASLWFKWMDDTVSGGNSLFSCFFFHDVEPQKSYIFALWLICFEPLHVKKPDQVTRAVTPLRIFKFSNLGFSYQLQQLLYPHMHPWTRFSPF